MSEALVENALRIISRKSESETYDGPTVVGFIHARPNSPLDKKMIDFLVKLKDGQSIPLQIKSSKRGMMKCLKRCRRLGITRHIIIVPPEDILAKVINRVENCLRSIVFYAERKIRAIQQSLKERQARKRSKKPWCFRIHAPQMCH